MYEPNRAMSIPQRLRATALVGLITVVALVAAVPKASANDINMAPAGCQATFLDQAFPMRWHEFYLLNPASNRTTWVICPTTWDEDVVSWLAGNSTNVQIHGAIQPGASFQTPLCFFGAADRDNLELDPYINIPGGKRNFIQLLGTTLSQPRWSATARVDHDSVRQALQSNSAERWGVSLFCQLPPGYAISNIILEQ
jgi:hypothetical protein